MFIVTYQWSVYKEPQLGFIIIEYMVAVCTDRKIECITTPRCIIKKFFIGWNLFYFCLL